MIPSYSRKRRLVYLLLYLSGISRLIMQVRPRKMSLVLTGHRVLEAKSPMESLLIGSGLAISLSEFERRIRFLLKYFRPATMAEYLAGIAGENSFVLTFDDGYRDNNTVALPILQRYDIPIHIFVTTGFVNGQVIPWVDRVAQACTTAIDGIFHVGSLDLELQLTDLHSRCSSFDRLCYILKSCAQEHIVRALADIESLPGVVPLEGCAGFFLSQSDLANSDRLVSYGAHSVTHANFRLLDRKDIAVEIEESRKWLEGATGNTMHTFAYPFGISSDSSRDYFSQALASSSSNWRHVFGTGSGQIGNPIEDRRLNINLQPFYVFYVQVSGAWSMLIGR